MSLDRLINLARITGDRLIVHQPDAGNDIVIMSVDEYETLLDDKQDVRTLSERQLIDKINRDIAIWRANDKFDDGNLEKSEKTAVDDADDEEDSWSSAASILDDKFDYLENDFLADESEKSAPEARPEDELDKETLRAVPWVENSGRDNVWQEEALPEDEPVFYEEPV